MPGHAPTRATVEARLARPDLLGRYLALNGFGFQLGGAAGRAIGGFALAFAPNGLWLVAAGIALTVGAAALALDRVLPEHVRRTPVAAHA